MWPSPHGDTRHLEPGSHLLAAGLAEAERRANQKLATRSHTPVAVTAILRGELHDVGRQGRLALGLVEFKPPYYRRQR